MRRGSIILIPFYFTDFRSYKFRPGLIVSLNQSQTDDFIVAFISTILPSKELLHSTHFIVSKNESYFNETGLHTTSIIKCDKLMTINKSIMEGWLGEIPGEVLKIIDNKLKLALALK